MSRILVTGGAGFIGSHTCLVLLEQGHELVVLDSFDNSSPESLRRVQLLAGSSMLHVVKGDIRDPYAVEKAFKAASPVDGVIHFAGLKAVAESVADPLRYWDVNLSGTRTLLAAMNRNNCRTIVFSSSATVYGHPKTLPIPESATIQPINPYGCSKAAVEQLLRDLDQSRPYSWRIASLRYFNPVGAHPSGLIGEDPLGIPNNLFPFICQVAVAEREQLQVFGNDWPTADGTGIRDYIHVMDLAEGHLAALNVLMSEPPQLLEVNLGSGRGHSVFELVHAFEAASGISIPYEVVSRRAGDVTATVADPMLAAERLGWRTRRSLDEMCRDGWAWQKLNPQGYVQAADFGIP